MRPAHKLLDVLQSSNRAKLFTSALCVASTILAAPKLSWAAHTELTPVTNLFIDCIPFEEYAASPSLSADIMKGSTLNVTFTVAGARFSAPALSSIPVSSVWDHSAASTVTVHMPDGSVVEAGAPDLHYSGTLDDGSASVRATLYDDGVHLVIFDTASGRLFQIDPVEHIRHSLSDNELETIGGASHVSLVPSTRGVGEPIYADHDVAFDDFLLAPAQTVDSSSREVSDSLSFEHQRATVDVSIPSVGFAPLWSDCFPNILKNHTARIAFYVTYGTFLQLNGAKATSPVKTLAKLGQVVTDMNIIYEHQLRITVQVHTGRTKVMMAPNTDPSANYTWNYGPNYCTATNKEGVYTLQQYVNTQPKDITVASHFLVTVCPDDVAAGNAFQPGACSSNNNIGSVVFWPDLWLIMSHEFGHNLNASHAFQEGKGQTGGVMDYADGRYPVGTGYYGFHPVYNKKEICPYLSKFQGTACLPLSSDVKATCGNGIVEATEDCDPGPGKSSPCCTATCKFVKQCDYMVLDPGAASCCNKDCTFASPSNLCGKQRMCRDGACVDVACAYYDNLNACATGECSFGCAYNTSDTCYPGTKWGWGSLIAPNGTHCGSGGKGLCSAGVCAPSPTDPTPPKCGNGIVEAGESCDPPSACCTSNCTFASPSTVCGKQSMCRDGTCSFVACSTYTNLKPCATGECTFGCAYNSSDTCYPGTKWGWGSLSAPNGTHCGSGGSGICSSGVCVPSATSTAPTCGNGILEPGESCDPPSACCTSNCTFASPSTLCGKQSMCRDGTCTQVACNTYSNLNACATGECTFGCAFDKTTTCLPGTQWGWGSLMAPNGTRCGSGGKGVCSTGVCTSTGSTATAECGNGIVEPGEACDPPSACCTSSCTFAPANSVCGKTSMCRNGQCLDVKCSTFSNLNACPLGDCTYGCSYDGSATKTCYSGSNFGWGDLFAPNGTRCGSGPWATCSSGICTTMAPTSSISPKTHSTSYSYSATPTPASLSKSLQTASPRSPTPSTSTGRILSTRSLSSVRPSTARAASSPPKSTITAFAPTVTRPGPVCGNGIFEAGESCDPPGACCNRDCTFSSPRTVCGPQSLCRDGKCVPVRCASLVGVDARACGIGECVYGCRLAGDASETCRLGTELGLGPLAAANGTRCGAGGVGVCAGGVCVPPAGGTGGGGGGGGGGGVGADGKAVCGNGVVEAGEACDPPSACCTSACGFAPPSVACGPGAQSYCSNGACVASSCALFGSSLRWCGRGDGSKTTHGCTYGCDFGSGPCYDPSSIDGMPPGGGYAVDGSACDVGKVCRSGRCESEDIRSSRRSSAA